MNIVSTTSVDPNAACAKYWRNCCICGDRTHMNFHCSVCGGNPWNIVEKGNRMDLIRLSKALTYMLRHNPDQFGITLDSEGWTDYQAVLDNLRTMNKQYAGVTRDDIQKMMDDSDKQRFEVDELDDRIRAVYGHSTKTVQIQKTPSKPPTLLYHGTSPQNTDKIKASGLKKMNRQYVHLSTEAATAIKVGKRHHQKPAILVIDALQAHKDGVEFYASNDDVWLTNDLDVKYILNFKE